MRILLDAAFDNNFGDDLLIHMILTRYKNVHFFVIWNNSNHKVLHRAFQFPNMTILPGRCNVEDIKPFDAYVKIGGDVFQDQQDQSKCISRMQYVKKNHGFIALLGFNLFEKYGEKTKSDLRKIAGLADFIVTRDHASAERFRMIAPEATVVESTDMAFTKEYSQYKKREPDLLGIAPRRKMYSTDETHHIYCRQMATIADTWLQENQNRKVRFLAFSTGVWDDRITAGDIQSYMTEKNRTEIKAYTNDINGFMEDIQECSALLATRFHAMVFSIIFHIPFVPVPYEVKLTQLLDEIGYSGIRVPYGEEISKDLVYHVVNALQGQYMECPGLKKYCDKSKKFFGKIDQFIESRRQKQLWGRKLIEEENIKQLRVAGILDEISRVCFPYECRFLELDTKHYIEQLEEFQPQLLFVESAWHGINNLWARKINGQSIEIKEILTWCNERDVPTVFWNKEDPVHFELWLAIASKFDWVYTTDMDCVPLYKRLLKHNRVGVLPFAVCVQKFNPVETYDRYEKACFAGSWYAWRKERCEDSEKIFDVCLQMPGLDIYDRNLHRKGNLNYTFPEKYQDYIVGNLPMNKMDLAYKGYEYGITINTVKTSSTMEARRVFELLACNTIVISNSCAAIKNLFGELVITYQNKEQLKEQLQNLKQIPNDKERLSLAALRKVMLQHTYKERLEKVCQDVLGWRRKKVDKEVCVFSYVQSVSEAYKVLKSQKRQTYHSSLYLIVDQIADYKDIKDANLIDKSDYTNITNVQNADFYCYFSPKNYYGKNYIQDLMVATKYATCPVIGKGSYYKKTEIGYQLENQDRRYVYIDEVLCDRSVVAYHIAKELYDDFDYMKKGTVSGFVCLSIDYFNFCQDEEAEQCSVVDDGQFNEGVSIEEIYETCKELSYEHHYTIQNMISGQEFLRHMPVDNSKMKLYELPEGEMGIYSIASELQEEVVFPNMNMVPSSYLQANTIEKHFPLPNKKMKDLKVATIVDLFILEDFKPECKILELTPDGWRDEVDYFQPDILFIGSAWRGKDGLWRRKVDRYSEEMEQLTTYIRKQQIPIVFWNIEDPVHFERFILTAEYADLVFTTDIDSIKRYKLELGHERVYHLHFAAQPKLHNPIEIYDRKDKFCFAGTYYHKYQERSRKFDEFARIFLGGKGLDIYDRNYLDPLPMYAFPEQYKSSIIGTLSPDQMDVAYKGYVYGVNMNTVKKSQTMFAMRVFEILASNTVVVGNFSKGVKNYFGDLTICTDDTKMLEVYLEQYCGSLILRRKYCLQGLRKVLREHLYEDRLGYITEKLYGKNLKPKEKTITVIAKVKNDKQAEYVEKIFNRQVYGSKKLLLVGELSSKFQEKYTCYTTKESQEVFISQVVDTDYVAAFSVHDWYGENYLLDLMLTLRYTQADVVGKCAAYRHENGTFILEQDSKRYQFVDQVQLRRGMASKELLSPKLLSQYLKMTRIKGEKTFSIDEFNYCENYTEDVCAIASDMVIEDTGFSLEEIEPEAEGIEVFESLSNIVRFSGEDLLNMTRNPGSEIKFTSDDQGMNITSSLSAGQHVYLFAPAARFNIKPYIKEKKLPIRIKGSANMNVKCAVICYNQRGEKLEPRFVYLNKREQLALPEGTDEIELRLRLEGAGTAMIKEILIGSRGQIDTYSVDQYKIDGKIRIFFDGASRGDVRIYIYFIDDNRKEIKKIETSMGKYTVCEVPENTKRFYFQMKLGFNSSAYLKEVVFNAFPKQNIKIHGVEEKKDV